jgi:hypothetical protein
MQFAIVTAAAVLAVSVATSTTSLAAAKKSQVAAASVNECINLARKRGYTESDLDSGGSQSNPARRFVIQCLQGKQR